VPWLPKLLSKMPAKVAVALANKMARITWAVLAKGGTYDACTRRSRLKGLGKWGLEALAESDNRIARVMMA
jgi:hypothetical protein